VTGIRVRVKPRSSRRGIVAFVDGVWQVGLHSPPEGGKANKELLKVLSKALQIPVSDLNLVSGEKSRNKTVETLTITEPEAMKRLTESASGTRK